MLGWLDEPCTTRYMRLANDDGTWEQHRWDRVGALVHDAARQISERRRERGGPVAIVLPTGTDFVATFFGAMLAGNTPCPLAPPNPLQDPVAYTTHVAALIRAADPSLVVTSAQYAPLIEAAIAQSGRPDVRPPYVASLEPGDPHPAEPPAELALLQFTSGSSGRPRAARVTWRNLAANIDSMADWTYATPEDDQLATWLPHYHDMGLIGCLIPAAMHQGDIWVMRPEQFVRRPIRWLECFGRHGVTLGGAPTFGFMHILRRARAEQLEGMDFSPWRVAVAGAERIDAAVLSRFYELLEPFGFRARTFVPGYGLAEATLLVTGRYADAPAPAVKIDWPALRFGEPVEVTDRAAVGDLATIGDGVGWLVSCGWPGRGIGLAVVGEDGEPLPDGHLGELFVTGRCVVDGYHGDDEVGSARFAGGGLRTGDAGFVLDGEVYVVGRIGDSVKVRGRAVYVEDLEARLMRIDGIPAGRCAVFTGAGGDAPVVVALVEAQPGDWVAAARQALRDELGDGIRTEFLTGRAGAIARTSSGKPRRRVMWRQYVEGELAATPAEAAEHAGIAGPRA